jgi:hypothetical protein
MKMKANHSTTTGKNILNVVPAPYLDSTSILPKYESTIRFTIKSSNPVPLIFIERKNSEKIYFFLRASNQFPYFLFL